MKRFLAIILAALHAVHASFTQVSVSVDNGPYECYEKIEATAYDEIADWYGYGAGDSFSANTPNDGNGKGLEDYNGEYIAFAAVTTDDGTSVVTIYDTPNQSGSGPDGHVETRIKCASGCDAGSANFLEAFDDPFETYSASGARTDTIHSWGRCCTDGFATKSLAHGAEVCVRIKPNDKSTTDRFGVDSGIRFYEYNTNSDEYVYTDITPGNYSPTKWTKVCIKNGGCGPGPCTNCGFNSPSPDGPCIHDNPYDFTCWDDSYPGPSCPPGTHYCNP